MSESKSNQSDSSSGKEIEARKDNDEKTLLNDVKSFLHYHHHQHKETHGNRDDNDEKTLLHDVKAPNVLERAKEEMETLFHHEKKESSDINGTRVETKLSESKLDSVSDKDVKAPNIFERVKQEIEAIAHKEGSPHHHKETHGLRDDIDEKTPLNDVKAPTAFERAKEEIEAIVQTIRPKKESQTGDGVVKAKLNAHSLSGTDIKPAKSIEIVEKPSEADNRLKKSPPRHHKETHGRSDDIDENTQIGDVKGPNVFERAKEELEALVEAIHPKKESNLHVSSTKSEEGGFKFFIGRWLEKMCRPWSTKKK